MRRIGHSQRRLSAKRSGVTTDAVDADAEEEQTGDERRRGSPHDAASRTSTCPTPTSASRFNRAAPSLACSCVSRSTRTPPWPSSPRNRTVAGAGVSVHVDFDAARHDHDEMAGADGRFDVGRRVRRERHVAEVDRELAGGEVVLGLQVGRADADARSRSPNPPLNGTSMSALTDSSPTSSTPSGMSTPPRPNHVVTTSARADDERVAPANTRVGSMPSLAREDQTR